jgi:hypothetical protein
MKNLRAAFPSVSQSAITVATLLVFVGMVLPASAEVKGHMGGAATDPNKVVGPERCAECHEAEFEAWKLTHHATTFSEMHRKPEAKEIVEKLGGKRIKRNEHCLVCHYTEGLKNDKPRALWGVTCESCHGQAQGWEKAHNDYGGKTVTKQSETPEHRKQRLAQTHAAANCFQCHTVPDEQLVNTGGHKARSDFDLVAWSQGEIRHNYQYSPDKKNRQPSPAHLRVLYVTGAALDLEYSLRAGAKATQAGPYLDAAKQAVAKATEKLSAVQSAQPIPEVAAMLEAVKGLNVGTNQGAALTKAADAVSAAAQKLVQAHDGETLPGIDGLLPAPSSYHGAARP